MKTDNRLLEDLARVAQGAAGAFAGLRDEIEARLKDHMDHMLTRMNLVRREEFEAVKAMASKARQAQESLAARVAALEGRRPAAKKPRRAAKLR
jgi:BMFP domain-containing protein YqiC